MSAVFEPADHASALIQAGHTAGRAWYVAQVNDEVLARLTESDEPKMAKAALAEIEQRKEA